MQIKRNGNKLLGQQTIYIDNGSGKKSKTLANLFEIDIKHIYKVFDKNIEKGFRYLSSEEIDFIKKDPNEIKHNDVKGYLGYANSHTELSAMKEIVKRSELLGGDVEVSCLETLNSFIQEMYNNYRHAKLREIAEQAASVLKTLTVNSDSKKPHTGFNQLKEAMGDDYKQAIKDIHDAYSGFDEAMKNDKLNSWTFKRKEKPLAVDNKNQGNDD